MIICPMNHTQNAELVEYPSVESLEFDLFKQKLPVYLEERWSQTHGINKNQGINKISPFQMLL